MLVGSEDLFQFFADPRDGGGEDQEQEYTADDVAKDIQPWVMVLRYSAESLIK